MFGIIDGFLIDVIDMAVAFFADLIGGAIFDLLVGIFFPDMA